MGIVILALGATAAAAFTVRQTVRPHPAPHFDPYTVWLMRNRPRSWRR